MATIAFKNEAFTDFSLPENKQAFEAALAQVRGDFGKHWDLLIAGERVTSDNKITSIDPADPNTVIGTVGKASKEQAKQAIDSAHEYFTNEWRFVDGHARARILFRAAAMLRTRKHEFSATMVYEESKNWAEADGDTAEAIDFLEFYAREMMRLDREQEVVDYPGDENNLYYIPLGVGVVIPPWNFPLAIMAGMTTATLVTGNACVLKPASTSPVVAAKFVDLLLDAGMPAKAITFCPGSGGEVGDTLVDHPKTRFIAFTGSKEVGLRIHERAAKVNDGQMWIKRTILEMGGKDGMVVDETADLDYAADQAVVAAYGFQGQKCSACSRVIAVDAIYDELVDKIVERVKKLNVDHPSKNPNLGAVIDAAAHGNIMQYIERAKADGNEIMCGGKAIEGGYFVEPTVFKNVKDTDTIAQEEIFGPVLACIRATDFEDALRIFNGTEFGLTGGLISNIRERLERARREFMVGNLYLNRKITGALVGVQPFGGFNMSGTDSKAGGQDYLGLFMQGKSVTEKF
ncbi:MAG TPA: L-glutamate gamma-semialdehyde dehydrogenase [Bacteroidetes bacterium]|nr:L-glutamate gamma-semialdehyde dehydrogenase [Bacteroidota bacterium]HEX04473.1 L-glutamate gamma-semialdehyde dehydrogenase [Bacteroidota bacterium]